MKKIIFEGTEEQINNLMKLHSDFLLPSFKDKDGNNVLRNLPDIKENYQTENLWCVGDMENWDCTREQALEVLHDALTNDATMEQIWYAIDVHAELRGIKRIDD